jgi:hypothetical protein
MTRTDLVQLAGRLTQGPVPTLHKKVYGYQGHITPLLEALPPAITIDTWVTTACHSSPPPLRGRRGASLTAPRSLPLRGQRAPSLTGALPLPTQVERIPAYLGECLTAHIQHLQTNCATGIIVLREAVLLAR